MLKTVCGGKKKRKWQRTENKLKFYEVMTFSKRVYRSERRRMLIVKFKHRELNVTDFLYEVCNRPLPVCVISVGLLYFRRFA
jgi:hypothetical protein